MIVAKVDVAAEEQENFIADIIEDTLNILRATKIDAKRVCFYTASSWKWQVYQKVLEKAVAGEVKMNEVMKVIAAEPAFKPHMKEAAGLVPRMIKSLTKLSTERKEHMQKIVTLNELEILHNAVTFLKDRFNADVSVFSEEDKERYDPKQKGAMALPMQPAIFIE